MKIALNIERVGAQRGGAEKYAATLARWLARRGHEVHVFAHAMDREALGPDIRSHPVRLVRFPGLRWLRAYLFAWLSERALRQDTFDLIIGFQKTWYQHAYVAVGGAHPATLACRSAQHRSSVARACWWLGKWFSPKEWVFRAIARRQFHTPHRPHIIAPSRIVAQHFRRYHGIEPQRICVVYNALDPAAPRLGGRAAFRRRQGLRDEDVALLFVARNYGLKGLEPLLAAFADVAPRHGRAGLFICGSARDGRYRRMARRLRLAERVRFLGAVDDIGECFAGCDAFVFPSFYDPCSLVVLEAMAAGLPVITTRQNGAGELLEEGLDGFVIESAWDVAALADRLHRLLADPIVRTTMGTRARVNVARHTVEARQDELWQALERAIRDPLADPRVRHAR